LPIIGSLPVIPTPFFENRIDYSSLERLFAHIFPQLEGYTLCGSTGEGVSLSLSERIELAEFAIRHTPPGKQVIVGLSHTNLEEMIILARKMSNLGIAGALVPAPYYFPNDFPMVREFFRELGGQSGIPLIFYDNPAYTKTWLRADELIALVGECPQIKGIKLTDHALAKISFLQNAGIPVFAGDDVTAFRSLLLGVSGSMIIAPSVFPATYQEVVKLVKAKDESTALRLFSRQILPFIHLFGPGDEIPVTKAVFKALGIFRSDEVRLPLLGCSKQRLSEVMMAYELGAESAVEARTID
jgi:4-hydroxy-tetrahydrodipicolinate synthase